MELKVVRGEEEFHHVKSQWDALVTSLTPTPLPLTHAWLMAWWKAFAANMQMEFRCVFDGEKLVGIAPLVRSRESYRGIPVTLLKLAANGHSPFSSIVVDASLTPSRREEALALMTAVAPREIALFFKIGQDSDLKRFLLDESKRGQQRVGEKPSLRTPVVEINQAWDDFYRARPRSLKKSLNNKLNRFRKDEGFSIEREAITQADQPIIDELVAISANSWKANIGNDLKSNTRSRSFLLNLIESFGQSGALSAWIVRHRGTPVAFELHVVCDEVVYPIRADYDEAFKSFSPGSVLEYSALKSLFEQGQCRQYYTCADDYWYLSNWTHNYRNLCSIELFGDSLKLRLLYFAEYRLIPLIKRFLHVKRASRRPA